MLTPGSRPEPFAARVALRPLPGGGTLAVLPNPHALTVTVAGTMRAGIACVGDGRFTVPTVTAAMLERGTRRHSRLQLARELEDHGLQLSVDAAGSMPAVVAFSGQGLAEELPLLADLLVETLREPVFPADELAKLRQQLLGGLAHEREETQPQAFGALTRRLYPAGHPQHRRRVEEREAELKALVREDLVAFHHQAYTPASMVLVVVGRVDPDSVATLFSDLLASWDGGGVARTTWPLPKPAAATEEQIHLADRPNLDVFLGHAAELRMGDADYPAAVLANSCLGQSTLTSRLGSSVRDEAGLTYGIYSRFFGTLELPGPWAVHLTIARQSLEPAVSLCRRVIAEYAAEGPGEKELADERLAVAGAFTVGLATTTGAARELVVVLTAGLPVSHLDEYPAQLMATERRQVLAALHRHIHPERLVMTVAGTLHD